MSVTKNRIIIVDDNDYVREQLAQTLTLMGYDVESYNDGPSFLSNSIETIPSVIILDMRMPKMSGLELQKEIMNMNIKSPIIFMSGESEPQEIIDAMKLGAIDFILKPFEIDYLISSITRAIEIDMARVL
jgi:FixJ family two-component response regulator